MHTILLQYDHFIPEHTKFNALVAEQLDTNHTLAVLDVSSYLREKLSLLAICKYNNRKQQTQVSWRRKAIYLSKFFLKSVLKINRETGSICSQYTLAELVGKKRLGYLRSMIKEMPACHLINLEWNGIKLGKHACVDLSLDCKSIDISFGKNSPQYIILQSLLFHSCALLEALDHIFQFNDPKGLRFISTTVYSLDWIAREYLQSRCAEHRFLIPVSLDHPSCRIYQTYCDDLLLLRKQQEDLVINKALLAKSCDFACSYLEHRLNPRTVHRYSPLSSNLNLLSEILSKLPKLDKIWTYFTNSPDELVSVNHGYFNSVAAKTMMPWAQVSFVTNEEQCLWILGKLAQSSNALLVIRHHPRLQPEQRSPFQSSSFYRLSLVCNQIKDCYPDNIFVVRPEDKINSYELALLSDRVISFRGTMPLEASLFGLRPIVMAKDQGTMNYWILLHAEAAPENEEELIRQLTLTDERYDPQELACFLCEFFLLQGGGAISLDSDSSKILLDEALISGSSRSLDQFSSTASDKIHPDDVLEIVSSYRARIRDIVYDSFF